MMVVVLVRLKSDRSAQNIYQCCPRCVGLNLTSQKKVTSAASIAVGNSCRLEYGELGGDGGAAISDIEVADAVDDPMTHQLRSGFSDVR